MGKKFSWHNALPVSILGVVFAASLYLKLIPVLNNNFPFTMDQARDMLDIRAIVELRKPALIGPTTSINGVFLGPFYYYFNLLPYVLSDGDPAALTYWNIFWYMLGGAGLFLFFYKKDLTFGLLSSIIFLMAPEFFYSSRFFWSANPMPYLTTFYFLSILYFLRKPRIVSGALIGLISGLAMQVEAAFGVLFFPFFLLLGVIRKIGIKNLFASLTLFSLTLIPQVLFEIRHDFIMTRTFFGEVGGKSQILGEKLTLPQIFLNHMQSYLDFSSGFFEIPKVLSITLILVSISYLSLLHWRKKINNEEKNIFFLSISFIIFSFTFYMLYSYPLKGWYLLGLRIPYLFLITLFLNHIIKSRFMLFKYALILLLGSSFFLTFIDQSKFIPKSQADRSTDKSTLRNEIEAIDWVYQKAQGSGFKAYNYIPSVYDFPYQYLYWWHGGKKYGYHPEVLTYLDNVPEYIKDNDKFLNLKKTSENPGIFLIYEPDEAQERLLAWLGNFAKYCSVEKQAFPWGTIVEYRKPCEN